MNRKKRRTIALLVMGITFLLFGTMIGYLLPHRGHINELEQKTKQIESLKKSLAEQKKENENQQKEIKKAEETITNLEEQLQNADANENTEDTAEAEDNDETETNKAETNETETNKAETNKDDQSIEASNSTEDSSSEPSTEETADTESDEQSDTSTSKESTEAIKLVKEYVGYTNDSNIHFDIEGNVPGSSDICIHVYEVIDDGESQHMATQGWYGVNLDSKKVYNTEGI